MRFLCLLFCFTLFVACANEGQEVATEETEMTAEAVETSNIFGEPFEASEIMAVNDFSQKVAMEGLTDTLETTLRGTVNEVCQKKGCWMTIAAGEEEMMVRFKDYGFFMPMDISGREVVMHGKAYVEETPVDELRHYAEDAGKSAEEIAAITEPKREMKFLASGVELLEASK
ncbi:DUF4920 domain-containing protein [Lewinella sp. W8]|uniref:DUF4920 domain-containing protein n=1 Tax=Lewinella sp. W8 TaxID=2528208 RepID=UPI001068BF66|nr:DUF4920 domain-containing protein [Lewinella sp. W8]MTB51801.1 DUF4920 domain-containing protein [Lewinella sp. W8]